MQYFDRTKSFDLLTKIQQNMLPCTGLVVAVALVWIQNENTAHDVVHCMDCNPTERV